MRNAIATERFYAELPRLDDFVETTNIDHFVPVPDDWVAVITDITGSTQAIEAGRYKDVNLLGASSIAAVLNQAHGIDIPFVFGGDGASLLLPPTLIDAVKSPLHAIQAIAQNEFNLELRVGFVPLSDIRAGGYDIRIAKLKVSPHYDQALFAGGGLNYATDLIKSPDTAPQYQLQSTDVAIADFSGLECRWQSIPSQHGEIVSLLVLATARHTTQNYQIYRDVISKIYDIYGRDEDFRPVTLRQLRLALNSKSLQTETKVRAGNQGWWKQWLYLSQVQFETILGLIFMQFRLQFGTMNWGNYKNLVITTSDYKKFDDMLRMIISGTAAQREALIAYLRDRAAQGDLVYGFHVATAALMTCLVFERDGSQVHFIDGADGGYALAAKGLKAQLKQKTAHWQNHRAIQKMQHILRDRNSSTP